MVGSFAVIKGIVRDFIKQERKGGENNNEKKIDKWKKGASKKGHVPRSLSARA